MNKQLDPSPPGPQFLLHLYSIYAGYTFLGIALGSLSPFLREVSGWVG